MKRIDLMFFDAGGGHRSAATALKQVIQQQGRPWDARLVNVQDILEPLDIFKKITGIRGEDVYNLFLRRGWTLGSPQILVAMHGIIRIYHKKQVEIMRKFWREDRPDLVVSVVPNFNRSLFQSLLAEIPGTPMVTVMTDLADYPPHFWMEKQKQYFICGSTKAVEQARSQGHGPDRVFRTSGMILNPKFYDPVDADRASVGLAAEIPTAVVLFGGHGSSQMLEIARRIQQARVPVQLILLCGHNVKLVKELRALKGPVKMHVESFTPQVPRFMKMSDFLIGKPGPGSISEAMAMDLPVIVERNAWTMPQERYNAEWIQEQGIGIVLGSFHNIVRGVQEMIEPVNFAKYRDAVAKQSNRAVFEIPDILEKIMKTTSDLRCAPSI